MEASMTSDNQITSYQLLVLINSTICWSEEYHLLLLFYAYEVLFWFRIGLMIGEYFGATKRNCDCMSFLGRSNMTSANELLT